MKRRLFLLLLVFILILVNALLTKLMDTSILSNAELMGLVPIWQLQIPLVLGLFGAASLAAALGIGALFWAALLPVCGAGWAPQRTLLPISRGSAWCAWPMIACCCTALAAFVFPWMQQTDLLGSADGRVLFMAHAGVGLIIVLAVRILLLRHPGTEMRLLAVFLCAALALSCGLIWWWGQALPFLAMALAGSLALALLVPQSPAVRSRLALLLAVSLAICVYVIGFGNMMTGYAPLDSAPAFAQHRNAIGAGILIALIPLMLTRNPRTIGLTVLLAAVFCTFFILLPSADTEVAPLSEGGAGIRLCAGIAAGLTLALSLSRALRESAIGVKVCALLALADAALYTWLALYGPVELLAGMDVSGMKLSLICFGIGLLLQIGLSLAFLKMMLAPVPREEGESEAAQRRH